MGRPLSLSLYHIISLFGSGFGLGWVWLWLWLWRVEMGWAGLWFRIQIRVMSTVQSEQIVGMGYQMENER